jgi:hypothetical protein
LYTCFHFLEGGGIMQGTAEVDSSERGFRPDTGKVVSLEAHPLHQGFTNSKARFTRRCFYTESVETERSVHTVCFSCVHSLVICTVHCCYSAALSRSAPPPPAGKKHRLKALVTIYAPLAGNSDFFLLTESPYNVCSDRTECNQ